jgi:hypothetical protein
MRTFEALSTIEGRFFVSLQVAEAISFAYELSDLLPSSEFLIWSRAWLESDEALRFAGGY